MKNMLSHLPLPLASCLLFLAFASSCSSELGSPASEASTSLESAATAFAQQIYEHVSAKGLVDFRDLCIMDSHENTLALTYGDATKSIGKGYSLPRSVATYAADELKANFYVPEATGVETCEVVHCGVNPGKQQTHGDESLGHQRSRRR